MTTTIKAALKTTFKAIDPEALSFLARATGPCITLQVPDFHPGAPAGSRHAHLRQLTQTVRERLSQMSLTGAAAGLADAFENLTTHSDIEHGGPGITIFCSPGIESIYETPGVPEQLTIGSRFHLAGVLAQAMAPKECYVLGISKKHVNLWHHAGGETKRLALPTGVPESLEEALGPERPDENMENRSPSGPGLGSMRGVRFGTSADNDADDEYLHKFFASIDHGLKGVVKHVPLLLVGVREELAEFRRVAKLPHMLDTEWHANPEHVTLDQVATHARDAAMRDFHVRSTAAFEAQRGEPLVNPAEIAAAAADGRVHRLFVAANAAPVPSPAGGDLPGMAPGDDLMNAAIVETLRTSGELVLLPGEFLPRLGPIAAAVRY
jgi:hypothetical protein